MLMHCTSSPSFAAKCGSNTLRIAVALSGGVDSSVTALLLQRCVRTEADLAAMLGWPVQETCTCSRPDYDYNRYTYYTSSTKTKKHTPIQHAHTSLTLVPDLSTVQAAVLAGTPWSDVVHGDTKHDCNNRISLTACPLENAISEIGTRNTCANVHENDRHDCFPAQVVKQKNSRRVELVPLYMRNWHDDMSDTLKTEYTCQDAGSLGSLHTVPSLGCAAQECDYDDASAVARELRLIECTSSLPVIDLSAEYVERCFNPMLCAYAAGHTCNIDALCNREIKFGALLQRLCPSVNCSSASLDCTHGRIGKKGAELIATGHYARNIRVQPYRGNTHTRPCGSLYRNLTLLTRPHSVARDLNDQTSFLALVQPTALARAIFPLGHIFGRKSDVRALAKWWGSKSRIGECCHNSGREMLLTQQQQTGGVGSVFARLASKKTSTGLCFVGNQHRSSMRWHSTDMSQTDAKNIAGAPAAFAQAQPKRSRLRFANFLREYIDTGATALPFATHIDSAQSTPSLLGQTEFVDADTGMVLPRINFVWSVEDAAVMTHYGSVLPAFIFTVGQQLLYRSVDMDGRSTQPHKNKIGTCSSSASGNTSSGTNVRMCQSGSRAHKICGDNKSGHACSMTRSSMHCKQSQSPRKRGCKHGHASLIHYYVCEKNTMPYCGSISSLNESHDESYNCTHNPATGLSANGCTAPRSARMLSRVKLVRHSNDTRLQRSVAHLRELNLCVPPHVLPLTYAKVVESDDESVTNGASTSRGCHTHEYSRCAMHGCTRDSASVDSAHHYVRVSLDCWGIVRHQDTPLPTRVQWIAKLSGSSLSARGNTHFGLLSGSSYAHAAQQVYENSWSQTGKAKSPSEAGQTTYQDCPTCTAKQDTQLVAQATAHSVGHSWRALAAGQIFVAYLPTSTLLERMQQRCMIRDDEAQSSSLSMDDMAAPFFRSCSADKIVKEKDGSTCGSSLCTRGSPHFSVVLSAWIAAHPYALA